MKKIILQIGLCASTALYSQVGINNANPKATLDITAKTTDGSRAEGLIPPRLSGDNIKLANNFYNVEQKGTIVYVTSAVTAPDSKTANITKEGYYYFDGFIWQKLGSDGGSGSNGIISITTFVDPNILGYVPSSTSNASMAPNTATIPVATGAATATKQGVTTFPGNGHSYASYSTNKAVSWYEAYYYAKSVGGYLATFINDDEWQHVESTIITPKVSFDTKSAWIGFAKYSWYAGSGLTPDPEMKWITGELPTHNYDAGGSLAIRKSNWFASGEPNNQNNSEGFVHTWYKNMNTTVNFNGYTSTHPWNDVAGNTTGVLGFIIEFNQ